MHEWFRENRINQAFSTIFPLKSNLRAESLNRTLLDKGRTMIHLMKTENQGPREAAASGFPWTLTRRCYSVAPASYIRIRGFHTGFEIRNMTQYDTLTGNGPDISHLSQYDAAKSFSQIPKQCLETENLEVKRELI